MNDPIQMNGFENQNKRDLSFFMREEREEIVTAPAPESFKDGQGKVIDLQIKVLPRKRINEIFENYRKRSVAVNAKNIPYINSANNEVLFKVERDDQRAARHIIAEALVYPDLRDKDLMAFYKCNDMTEMPDKVFPKADEFNHVNRMVLNALGLGDNPIDADGTTSDEEILDDAKN